MTHDGARGTRFVAGMIAALCAICGLAALFGVPAADGVFLGLGGMLLGMGAARFLLPRRDWGSAGRTALVFLAIGGLFAGYHLSVIGFSTVRGVMLWGLYFGFWSVAVQRLTDPIAPERTGGKGETPPAGSEAPSPRFDLGARSGSASAPHRLCAPECVAMRSSEGRA